MPLAQVHRESRWLWRRDGYTTNRFFGRPISSDKRHYVVRLFRGTVGWTLRFTLYSEKEGGAGRWYHQLGTLPLELTLEQAQARAAELWTAWDTLRRLTGTPGGHR